MGLPKSGGVSGGGKVKGAAWDYLNLARGEA